MITLFMYLNSFAMKNSINYLSHEWQDQKCDWSSLKKVITTF